MRKKETVETFLEKPRSVEIINLVRRGRSYDSISKSVHCSKSTVTKVMKLYTKVNDTNFKLF